MQTMRNHLCDATGVGYRDGGKLVTRMSTENRSCTTHLPCTARDMQNIAMRSFGMEICYD